MKEGFFLQKKTLFMSKIPLNNYKYTSLDLEFWIICLCLLANGYAFLCPRISQIAVDPLGISSHTILISIYFLNVNFLGKFMDWNQ